MEQGTGQVYVGGCLPGQVYISGVYLAVETLGTRSRLAATVASFKAEVGGAEGRAVWGWAGETAPTWLLWLGRDWGEDEEEEGSDPRADSPDLLRDEEEEYGGLEGPDEEEEFNIINTSTL